jgi:PEP-CTERM motif.
MASRFVAAGAALLLTVGLASLAPQARAESITTLFAGNNNNFAGGAQFFDINVLNTAGITITSLAVNVYSSQESSISLNIYARTGTYLGNAASSVGWTLVSSGTGVNLGRDVPSVVDVTDFTLAEGITGIAIQNVDWSAAYTNGNGTNQSYSNSDLSLTLGGAENSLFDNTFYYPRVANVTINYTIGAVTAVPEPGTFALAALAGGPLLGLALSRRRRNAA